ncbi:MAG: MBL fold metallo-hydrolase [Bacteroidales bacterium]|nr:MBL fold metallo-hydrolase [Bacteroidales bacterium]MCM1414716.1 MBL fold metallo-hydrolase [bacterium]MCM1422525.1 MBL fold metallo-hydrolase [bacterium]
MNLNHITVNTQSSIRIEGSKILYFDPFQIETAAKDADIIFITHEHYDHFDPPSIVKIKKEDTLLIAPKSMEKKALAESGISSERCFFYQPGETHEQADLTIETVPAYNRMKPFHTKGRKWQGYVVTMDGVRYYVSGDTDVNEEMESVQCDVAMIPIGGFYTMDKKQAADYIAKQKPKAVIPTHYGSIVGEKADGRDFQKALEGLDGSIQVELKLG